MFDLKNLDPEDVPYLGLLKSVLGFVDTAHFSYGELSNESMRKRAGFPVELRFLTGQIQQRNTKRCFL